MPRAPADPALATEAATSVNGFALDFLRDQLSAEPSGTQPRNLAFSPWSIVTALAMARAGARGGTAAEMDRVLHFADADAAYRDLNALQQVLAQRNTSTTTDGTPSVLDLTAANRAFVQRGYTFSPAYLKLLASQFGTGLGLEDYVHASEAARLAINAWVAAHTENRITQLLAPGILDALTRLVLVNAVYFHADWETPFMKEATSPAPFHAFTGPLSTPFMHTDFTMGYSSGTGWQAVELPYVGGNLALDVVVPSQGRFGRVAASFDDSMLARVTAFHPVEVVLSLPKFNLSSALSLNKVLSRLGMPTAFTDGADFSAMGTSEPLEIADVIHQADITVDERGTTAAAATAVIVGASSGSVGPPPQVVDADHPFLYLLRDRPTGAIIFAGAVTNPAIDNPA